VFSGENAALCTAVVAAQATMDEGPEISATTSLAELQAYVREISAATRAVNAAAGQAADMDLGAVTRALALLEGLTNVLSGDTVGNAAATVNPALSAVRMAYEELATAAGCD
jgi:hypothetical protein